eukprot:6022084-Pyramimonas_sp.AAC.1
MGTPFLPQTTFAREQIFIPSPLLRTGVQTHRTNAVSASTKDIRKTEPVARPGLDVLPAKQAMSF